MPRLEAPRGRRRARGFDEPASARAPRGRPQEDAKVLGEREPREIGELRLEAGPPVGGRVARGGDDARAERLEGEPRPRGDPGPAVGLVGAPSYPAPLPREDLTPGLAGADRLAPRGEVFPEPAPPPRRDEEREGKVAHPLPGPEREAAARCVEKDRAKGTDLPRLARRRGQVRDRSG